MGTASFLKAVPRYIQRVERLVERCKIFPRPLGATELDQILLALLNRSNNTVKAMVLVATKNYGGEATALSRVLVEQWLIVRWMTNKDEHERAARFAQYEGKQVQKALERLHAHDSSIKVTHKQDTEMKKFAALYSSHIYWAGTLRKMAEEPEERDASLKPDATWYYNIPYTIGSWFVHSNVMGVRDLAPAPRQAFKFRRKDPNYTDMAVMMGALCFALTTARISDTLGLGISDQVLGLYRKH